MVGLNALEHYDLTTCEPCTCSAVGLASVHAEDCRKRVQEERMAARERERERPEPGRPRAMKAYSVEPCLYSPCSGRVEPDVEERLLAPGEEPAFEPAYCRRDEVVDWLRHILTAKDPRAEARAAMEFLVAPEGEEGGPRLCPWPDFAENPIREGDIIRHPTGETGRVVFLAGWNNPTDQWRVDYGDGLLSRLCLQIGDKGMAVVVNSKKEEGKC